MHETSDHLGPRVPIAPGDPEQRIAARGMILRVLVGSTVHGTAIDGQDDRDEMGICLEPPETLVGLRRFTHYEFRTAEQREPAVPGHSPCSGPDDLDLIVYSLRRYVSLAARGNPTMLLPLFVPDDAVCFIDDIGAELREQRSMLLSRQAGARFKGYLHSQRRGLMGLRSGGSRNQGRADIRARYGFDSKFAMHMVRLGYQGEELLETGRITLPMRDGQLTRLRELRRARRSKEWALAEAERLERRIDELTATTELPEQPDWERIDAWLVDVHRRFWARSDEAAAQWDRAAG